MPKARTPRTWVTVLASQPSVSIETDDDAADVLAELAGLADGVHHLAEQVLVGRGLGVAAGEAGAVLGLELVDLAGGDLLELGAHRLAGFELLAVDEDRVRAMQPAAVAVVVAEEGELAGHGDRSSRRAESPSPSRRRSRRPACETLVLLQTTMKTGGVGRWRCARLCSQMR